MTVIGKTSGLVVTVGFAGVAAFVSDSALSASSSAESGSPPSSPTIIGRRARDALTGP